MSRFIIASRVRQEIDLPDIFGNHEFTLLPRSIFSRDGNLLVCTDKSEVVAKVETLMVGNENLDDEEEGDNGDEELISSVIEQIITSVEDIVETVQEKAIILDGMALVNKLKKTPFVRNCSDLSELFLQRLEIETEGFDTVILLFDRYLEQSLKEMTRKKRNNDEATRYKVNDETNIEKVTLKKFLSHWQTKQELTEYLGGKAVNYFDGKRRYAVVCGTRCNTNIRTLDLLMPDHDQEEADTIMVLYAHYLANENPSQHVYVSSPDTDVFLLLVSNYKSFCKKTFFRTGKGEGTRDIDIEAAYDKIGIPHCSALLRFHAITGCDQTAKFNRRSKGTCWKKFRQASETMLKAMQSLGETVDLPTSDVFKGIEQYVMSLYSSNHPKNVDSLGKLRWFLFSKHQYTAEMLPPTAGALKYKIYRAHYMCLLWKGRTTDLLPAPEATIAMMICRCKTGCKTGRCNCKKNKLQCTEMCLCVDCENVHESVSLEDSV